MKLLKNTKLLSILISIVVVCKISFFTAAILYALSMYIISFNIITFGIIFLLAVAAQFAISSFITNFKNNKKINKELKKQEFEFNSYMEKYDKIAEEYKSLDYKKFIIPLTCQECGVVNNVEMDLANTEFICKKCNRKNAIYVNFSSASVVDPITVDDFLTKAYGE